MTEPTEEDRLKAVRDAIAAVNDAGKKLRGRARRSEAKAKALKKHLRFEGRQRHEADWAAMVARLATLNAAGLNKAKSDMGRLMSNQDVLRRKVDRRDGMIDGAREALTRFAVEADARKETASAEGFRAVLALLRAPKRKINARKVWRQMAAWTTAEFRFADEIPGEKKGPAK